MEEWAVTREREGVYDTSRPPPALPEACSEEAHVGVVRLARKNCRFTVLPGSGPGVL